MGKLEISTLTMGEGPDVLLIHGLGATKASFFDTAAALARDYRVHCIDLPGFGFSSKPVTAPYDAKFFAHAVKGLMDELDIERAHFVGNSMGGKVALEVGLRWPERVAGLALLSPAVAFVKRDFSPIVRLLRPSSAFSPTASPAGWSPGSSGACSPTATRSTPASPTSPSTSSSASTARPAPASPSCGAQHLPRCALRPRRLLPAPGRARAPGAVHLGLARQAHPGRLLRHVAQWLPGAEQIVLRDCGHVPQIERPEQTNGLLRRFFAQVDALGAAPVRRTAAAA